MVQSAGLVGLWFGGGGFFVGLWFGGGGFVDVADSSSRYCSTSSATKPGTRTTKEADALRSEPVLPWHRYSVGGLAYISQTSTRPEADFVVSSDLPGLFGASLAARALGVPHVHDCHELYLESTSLRDIERRLLAPIERRYMRRADAIVIVNESIRREYAERYGVEGTVIRNCAEQGDMQSGQDLYGLTGQLPDAQLVLYQGGLSVGRGLEVVVEAVAGFPDKAHLVMMGYGPLEQVGELKAHEVEERAALSLRCLRSSCSRRQPAQPSVLCRTNLCR